MLKSIDPLLNADLLHVLSAMGHGDELVVSDLNFPSDAVARETSSGKLVRIDGADSPRVIRAILSLLPLDTFVEKAVHRMQVVGSPDEIVTVQREVQAEIDRAEPQHGAMGSIERHAFYARARKAYAVVRAGERRFYGCFILTKGVIGP